MKNKSDEPRLTLATQTRRPQRLNPLPIQNSARIPWFLLLGCPQQRGFVCVTLSLVSLQHPLSRRIHTWRIRRVRRDSGAASAAAQSELVRSYSVVRQQETEGGGRINRGMLRLSISIEEESKMAPRLSRGCWEAALTSASTSLSAM